MNVVTRTLIAVDVWGTCKARHGGIPSKVCEFGRFMNIVEYLDAPNPMVTRLVRQNSIPFNFPGPDKTKPNRDVSDRDVKIYRMFNLSRKVCISPD